MIGSANVGGFSNHDIESHDFWKKGIHLSHQMINATILPSTTIKYSYTLGSYIYKNIIIDKFYLLLLKNICYSNEMSKASTSYQLWFVKHRSKKKENGKISHFTNQNHKSQMFNREMFRSRFFPSIWFLYKCDIYCNENAFDKQTKKKNDKGIWNVRI